MKPPKFATEGRDVLTGTRGADTVNGLGGDDIINGGAGNDTLSGGNGDDQVHGGAGNDLLYGDTANDTVSGGNDQLIGGGGDDTLIGGLGDDYLNGGGGSDTYVFNFITAVDTLGGASFTAAAGNDTIEQFQNAGRNVDVIDLQGVTSVQGAALFTLTPGDVNGDGTADSVISWTSGAAGSITILGSTWADLGTFLGDSRVHFII